jgi:rod shape-determining protein MreB
MRDGVIADYVITEYMLKHFIDKVCGRVRIFHPQLMICIPSGGTSVEQRAVKDAALRAGAREAFLIPEPLAAAIGANLPIQGPSGNMIIGLGGGTAEVAVISLGNIVVSRSVRAAGNKLDEAIANFVRKRYNLMIGERTAEDIKIQIGSALTMDSELTMEVRGRDLIAGLPRTITIGSNEITEAMDPVLQQIIGAVKAVLEETPPELASDVIDKGMVLSGGGALLRNMDKLMTQVTGVACYVAENPLYCVAKGTGIALEHLPFFRRSLIAVH